MNKLVQFLMGRMRYIFILAFLTAAGMFGVMKYRESRVSVERAEKTLSILKDQVGSSGDQVDVLLKKYEDLEQSYKQLEEDRNNVLTQAKELMKDKSRLTELEIQYLELVKKDHEILLENMDLTENLTRLTSDHETLKQALGAIEAENTVLQNELDRISQEYEGHDQKMRSSQEQIKSLENQLEELKNYKEKYEKLKEEHSQLVEESKKLAKDLKKAPSKFSKLAKENKTLVKETAATHYNLGVFYAEQKEYRKAMKEFLRASEIDPEDSKAHYNIGYIYAKEFEDHDKAIEHFRKYLGLAPGDESADWVKNYLSVRESFDGKVLKS
ncbi:MAG: tetratricopeptide repeat protein [Candidatus Omnitrophica bacterium]|nr:tetratricopeptide repeat protein [Candidatus Omnitrophota bacterium]